MNQLKHVVFATVNLGDLRDGTIVGSVVELSAINAVMKK